MPDIKLVYSAPTLEDAEYKLEEIREKWDKKYPQLLRSWYANWLNFQCISGILKR